MKVVKHQSVKGTKEVQEKKENGMQICHKSEFKRNTLIDLNGKRFHQFWFKFMCHPKSLGWADG